MLWTAITFLTVLFRASEAISSTRWLKKPFSLLSPALISSFNPAAAFLSAAVFAAADRASSH
ncbi:MAG: hypothetical protein ACD_47C00359G0001, partial [uncultured bacterium]